MILFLICKKIMSEYTFVFTKYTFYYDKFIDVIEAIADETEKKYVYDIKCLDKKDFKTKKEMEIYKYHNGYDSNVEYEFSKVINLSFNSLKKGIYSLFQIKDKYHSGSLEPILQKNASSIGDIIKSIPSDLDTQGKYKIYCVFNGTEMKYICYYDLKGNLREILIS